MLVLVTHTVAATTANSVCGSSCYICLYVGQSVNRVFFFERNSAAVDGTDGEIKTKTSYKDWFVEEVSKVRRK